MRVELLLGSNSNDNLSSMFLGLPIGGTWVLTIVDYFPPFNGGIPAYAPGITSWDLTIQATGSAVPEPSTAIAVFLFIGLMMGSRGRCLTRHTD